MKFSELSGSAKETAFEWLTKYTFTEAHDWEHVYEMAKDAGRLMGIEIDQIYFSGFWSQGDGACFEGSYNYRIGARSDIKTEFPQDKELHRIVTELQKIQSRNFYRLTASATQTRGNNMRVSVEDKENPYKDIGSAEDDVSQLLNDFANWIYRGLEKEYEYQTSEEQVSENADANGYEFDEEGKAV